MLLVISSCAFVTSGESEAEHSKIAANPVRLGYLPNVSHALALYGLGEGLWRNIEAEHFSSGGYLLNALITKNLDLAYLGPGPVINALNKKMNIRLLGSISYGANSFILNKTQSSTFAGKKIKKIAVPQFGNTQDLLARILVEELKQIEGGNLSFAEDLEFIAISPPELEMAFITSGIDAALVAEPWGTILEEHEYVNYCTDERQEDHKTLECKIIENILSTFPAAVLVSDETYYQEHKSQIDEFLKVQEKILNAIKNEAKESQRVIKKQLEKVTHKKFSAEFIDKCLAQVQFNSELDATKMQKLTEVANATYGRKGKSAN